MTTPHPKTSPAALDSTALDNEIPGYLFVDHVGIAVPRGELDAQTVAYELMGFRETHRETVKGSDAVREVMLRIGNSDNQIQLLEPLNDASTVQKAIDRNGGKGGLHHIAIRVRDAQVAFDHLRGKGFRIIDQAPRGGSGGHTVFFMHPKALPQTPFNVLIEIVQA